MTTTNGHAIDTAAVIGMGSVGSGWAALMLAKGLRVRAFDPSPGAAERSKRLIDGAWPSLVQLGLTADATPPFEAVDFCETVDAAVQGVGVVLENVPENLSLKHEILSRTDAAAPPTALILSSAGGIPTSELQSVCTHPERVVVMHPFNPAHLIPLVEIVPGKDTAPEATERAVRFAISLGKHPITLSKETPGHMVNRLQFALVREAIRCVIDGVASPHDIDAAVRFGLAPRWLLMGGLHTVALAGGPGGMRGILDHAGDAMQTWWATEDEFALTEDIKDQLVSAAEELSGGSDFEDWVSWRDSQLVALLGLQKDANLMRPGTPEGANL
ncbi:MAG: 3-hydroxyacyl-CoA dehydrogenase NAD-binding domain-containing protein [Pseudomonadota bacterium]